MARALMKEGNIIVETACNGFEGLQIFKNAPSGTFDCVITDIQMV
jgi:YesN/AraC family two-component response regulator